jgi:hypothetical protein
MPLWILKAIYKAFASLNPFFEGQIRNTDGLKTWIELRVDGPDFIPQTKDRWAIKVRLQFIITTTIDGADIYRHSKKVGEVFTLLSPLSVVDGSANEVVCLNIARNEMGAIRYINIGQVQPQARFQQSVIEVDYTGGI